MDGLVHVQRSLEEARVDRAEALRYIGHTGQDINEALSNRIDELIAHCKRTSKPAFAYRIFPLDSPAFAENTPDYGCKDTLCLPGSAITLTGEDIRAHLTGARAVAVLVCTAGLANEQELRRLSSASSLDALIYSTAGSSLVESAADICEACIAADAATENLITNSRFSPGYGDLPLSVQPAILNALDASKQLGVTATETNLLIPSKSTTAFIGLFDRTNTIPRAKISCTTCNCAAHCTLRKAGTPCFL